MEAMLVLQIYHLIQITLSMRPVLTLHDEMCMLDIWAKLNHLDETDHGT